MGGISLRRGKSWLITRRDSRRERPSYSCLTYTGAAHISTAKIKLSSKLVNSNCTYNTFMVLLCKMILIKAFNIFYMRTKSFRAFSLFLSTFESLNTHQEFLNTLFSVPLLTWKKFRLRKSLKKKMGRISQRIGDQFELDRIFYQVSQNNTK